MPMRSLISELAVSADSPRTLCEAIAGELASVTPWNGPALHPWDGAAPESCLWWAVPTPQWPGSRFPKLFFDWLHPDFHSDLLFGVHVEKGLETPPDERRARNSDWTMDAGWAWQRLSRDLRSDGMADLVRAVCSSAVPSLYLRIEIDDGVNPNTLFPGARILWREGTYYGFECSGADAGAKLLFAHDQRGLGSGLARIKSLPELAEAMEQIPNAGSCWIHWQLGVAVRVWDAGMDNAPIAPKELTARYVSPFAHWIIGSSSDSFDRELGG